MMSSECVWAFGEGSNFQLVRGPQSWGIFKQKKQFDPNFCWKLCRLWSCPFVRTHGSEIGIPGDSYLKLGNTELFVWINFWNNYWLFYVCHKYGC